METKLLIVLVLCAALCLVECRRYSPEDEESLLTKRASQETEEYTEEENLGNDKDVVEGDIIADKNVRAIMSNLNTRDAITDSVKHWPGGRVPYVFERGVSPIIQRTFQEAIRDFKRETCIRIVPRTTEKDYIHVYSGKGCSSALGRVGGPQRLSLGVKGCGKKGKSIHELMHAIGFFHEQSRLDRDDYITVVSENIKPDMQRQFKKYGHGEADYLGAAYDYNSIMHYPSKAFSSNDKATIIPKQKGAEIGQREGFSEIDLQQINKLYKCENCKDDPKYSLKCPGWDRRGYCTSGDKYQKSMEYYCKRTCGFCV